MRPALEQARRNLLRAHRAGVPLVAGTGSGGFMRVHGPAIHRELKLWVEAGIPPKVALHAATFNAARFLHAAQRIGRIRPGFEATLLLVDGDPLKEISATERITGVMFKGEMLNRGRLLDQK
jgi:imidazolonepropionase-like amidohydrolase